MGFLFDDLLLAPVKLVAWIGEKVKETAEAELFDESTIKKELAELQMQLETEEISEEIYLKKEKEIIKRLNYAQAKKEEEK